jgi:hypothetical protein
VANDGGLVLLFVVIVITGIRGSWVFRREVDRLERQLTDERVECMRELGELRSERDQWRAACLWHMGHPNFKDRPTPMPPMSEGD